MQKPTIHFQRGIDLGNVSTVVAIAVNGVWSARGKDGSHHISSCEKIGYHAGSVEFLDGVLSTGCTVVKCSWDGKNLKREKITENPYHPID